MRIKDTDKISNRIIEMWEERNFQGRVDDALFRTISENSLALENIEPVKAAAEKLRNSMIEKTKAELSEDEALMTVMLKSFVDFVSPGKFKNPYEESAAISKVAAKSRIFSKKDFSSNPYLKNIKFDNASEGRFELTKRIIEPFELMFYDVPFYLYDTNVLLPSVGCFKDRFSYPCLLDNKREWMALTPYEISTMQPHIDKAKGDLLVLGCGIGYYAYMTSLKEDVTSVTIIEKGKDVAELFRKYVLPQFEFKSKIKLIEDDAFSYIDNLPDGKYHMCFADIYDGMGNFDVYYRLRDSVRRFKKMKTSYWNEENFLSYSVGFAFLEIMEAFAKNKRNANTMYPNIPERERRLKSYIARLLKEEEILKSEDVEYYLNPKNLLRLMNKSKIEY